MNGRHVLIGSLAVVLVVSWSFPRGAAGQSQLANAKAVRCAFQRVAVGSWQNERSPGAVVRESVLVLRFDSIDLDSGLAQLRNGSVGSDVTVRSAEGYLHFMQAFRTGPLYTTTVFGAGSSGATFKAVHSRHEYFSVPVPDATSSPEQYYGECEIGR